MLPQLTNHLWQSSLFAVVAGLLTVLLRRNRAQVRYWLWLSASLKFLVPWLLLVSLAGHLQWRPSPKMAAPAVAFTMVEIAEPFSAELRTAPTARRSATEWTPWVIGFWACGFGAIALMRLREWRRIRAAVRVSAPELTREGMAVPIRSTPVRLEPGVVGVWRPVLLLPAGIEERLTRPQLAAVLAHELCHVRRRDNLFASIHMIVEAVFWFHPLVWWIGARLVEERERACDEAVLSLGNEPLVYAEGILNVCKFYAESPLACVSGVTGADLKKRLEAIMSNRIVFRLTFAKKAVIAAAGVTALAVPIFLGIVNSPAIRAQSPASATPKFEVASIKPCKAGDVGGPGGKGNTKAGGGGASSSPGRLSTACNTVEGLIHSAYVSYANGYLSRDPSDPPVEGGPDWIRSERYQIVAKADGTPGDGAMRGPMMQLLLEDRFKVKIHREARDMPVYALTVAKGGPRLAPFQEGSCTPIDFGRVARDLPHPEDVCKVMVGRTKGANLALEGPGMKLGDFAKMLYFVVDRPVIDRTGIAGRFDIHLEYAPEEAAPAFAIGGAPPDSRPAPAGEPTAPSIFAVVEKQLGLRLEKARGPRDFVVIDRVERPTEN